MVAERSSLIRDQLEALSTSCRLHRIYFDRSLNYHSPDPTDPAVTVRVITVMLAAEY
jgi:Protein of unknown function (DUF3768)